MIFVKDVFFVFVVFAYEDEKWVFGVRKNAYATNRDRSCAIVFPSAEVAHSFADVLTATYGGVFSVFSLDEVK